MTRFVKVIEGTVALVSKFPRLSGEGAERVPDNTFIEAPDHVVAGWGHDGTAFTPPVQVQPDVPPTRDLTRAEFNGMLAAKGFKPIWDAMRGALEGVDTEDAEGFRRLLESRLHSDFYNLEATLSMVGYFRGFATSLNPDYAELLTEDNITSAWGETVALSG